VKAPVIYKCIICKLPVEYSRKTTNVDMIAARSLSIIVNFLLHLSTIAPAMGLIISAGVNEKKVTNAKAVTFPVICQAQIVRENLVMLVPMSEIICPIQTMEKAKKPDGRFFDIIEYSFRYFGFNIHSRLRE
jgi:hypothetical protein